MNKRKNPFMPLQGLALHQTLTELCQSGHEGYDNAPLPKLCVRVSGLLPLTPLRDLRSTTCGQMVAVRGTVVRATEVKPHYQQVGFRCLWCGREQAVEQPGGYFTHPTSCTSRGCRSKSFCESPNSPLTRVVDWQSLRLQVGAYYSLKGSNNHR